jgi:DNA-binding transcriptional LysR family regulator
VLDVKLDTLLTVASCKNFTKAAEQLSMTQPAVSHHISMLEKEYNAKLFLRGNGDVKPTPEGEIAIRYARRLKALYETMLSEISNEGQRMAKIRIGITHTSESNTITEILAKYGNLHDNVSIMMITDTIKNLYDMIDAYELDIAIVEGRRVSPNLNYLMLDTDCLVCVLCNENPLAKQSMVTINELKREHMILRLPSSATRQLFEATLMGINETIDDFNVTLEVDNISTIKDLIRKGLGISILPQSACMDELRKGKLTALPIENLSMIREMNIVYHKDFSHIDVLKDIIKLYQDEKR